MKVLLLGKNGQVGWELQRSLAPIGELLALSRHDEEPFCGDLGKARQLAETIRAYKPDVVVNAAAYTAVDKAESEKETAHFINSQALALIAAEVAALDSWLIHYSTDYVFDGRGTQPWQETDPTAPINYYGQSKLDGEEEIKMSGCKHLIFRTSWVYGARGHNFIRTILRLAAERERLSIVADQIGAPTGAELLADVTVHCIRHALKDEKVSGLYNLVPQGEVSWYDYTHFIVESARRLGTELAVNEIVPLQSSDYVTPAKRPYNSRLATTKISTTFSFELPHWKQGVMRMLQEILG